MEKNRELTDLFLEGEDYIFGGDLTSIIVSGTLTVKGIINICCGDIVCEKLGCNCIHIQDGDICVKILSAGSIYSDSNIEVSDSVISTDHIRALNYLVSGDNDSLSITTVQDIYILGDNDSLSITAREVFIAGDCDLHDESLTAKRLECPGYLTHCSGITVG